MKVPSIFSTFLFGFFVACAAHGAGRVSIDEVAALGLMPTQSTPDKPGKWAQVPYLKFYFEDKLLATGLPVDFQKIPGAQVITAQPGIHGGVKVRQLSSELKSLKTRRTGKGPAVVLAYVSEPCPPCDSLIDGAIRKLKSLGYGEIEQIRVVVD